MSRAEPMFLLASLALIAGCSDQPVSTAPTARPNVALTSSPTSAPYSVSVVSTETLEGFPGSTYNIATGVSPAGDVAGVSAVGGSIHAARWSAGSVSPVDLGFGTPFDINAAGQVVGEFGNDAALWTPNGAGYTLTRIGTQIPNAGTSTASAINANGQVVGNYTIAVGEGIWARKCFVWTPDKPNATTGTVTTLPDFGGTFCVANDVNANGYVVGTSTTTKDESHAFVWTPPTGRRLGKIQDLTPNGLSYASAINDLNQIAGQATNDTTASAAIWKPGIGGGYVMTDLGPFMGNQTWAADINDAGFVVGFVSASGTDAFFWQNGEYTLLPGVATITSATAMTQLNGSSVQIVGGSLDNDTLVRTALRWTISVAPPAALP